MSTNLPPILDENPPSVLPKKRYHDLDALRAFAMLFGIVLHGLLSFAPNLPWTSQDIHQSEAYGIGFAAIHGFRMPLFFLVSGFFTTMMWRRRGFEGLFKHRMQRIVLPMVIFGAFLVPAIMIVGGVAGAKQAQMYRDGELTVAQAATQSEQAPELPSLGLVLEQLPEWMMWTIVVFCMLPVFHHMWFLYYLIWLVVGFMGVAWIAQKLKLKAVPGWFIASPYRLLWLLPATFIPQALMTMSFGADTAIGIVPWPPKMLYYAIFFGFGAVCFGREEFEEKVGRLWPMCLGLAVPAFILAYYLFTVRTSTYAAGFAENQAQIIQSHLLCTAFTVTYTWLTIFGLIGFFRAYCSGENPRIRYFSDASYWLYLMHLPIIMGLQTWVSDWQYPSAIKFIGICAVTTGILLVLYEIMVRYTWIGTMLNGKKTRKRTPPPLPDIAAAG